MTFRRITHPDNPTNADLWAVVDSLGTPRHHVRFTCREPKALYLMMTRVVWHLDDDPAELLRIRVSGCRTVGVQVGNTDWQEQCNRLLGAELNA